MTDMLNHVIRQYGFNLHFAKALVADVAQVLDPATFAEPHPDEGTRQYFPTRGDMITFLMTAHEMEHLGQVVAWRRAAGLGSATGV